MRRHLDAPRLLLASSLAALAAASTSSCSEAPRATTSVSIVPALVAPRALLDRTDAIELVVHPSEEATCDEATGTASLPQSPPLAEATLTTGDCVDGARFCGELTLDRAPTPRVFVATASDRSGAALAQGCATAVVDSERVALALTMRRVLPQATCGDGVIAGLEHCEPPGKGACDEACHTREIVLSIGAASAGTATGAPTDKSEPALLWPEGSGDGGRFFAFFTDKTPGALEIGMRVRDAALDEAQSPPAAVGAFLFLPNDPGPGGFPAKAAPRNQSAPAAALVDGRYYVAFQDDDSPGANGLDIHLRSFDGLLVADQPFGAPVGINGASGGGEPNAQSSPALAAGANGRLLVAWLDEGGATGQGRVFARTFQPGATLGSQNELSTGTGNKAPSIAPTRTGWVVVWESAAGIKMRAVGSDGTPAGLEQLVNDRTRGTSTSPRVASLGDGRFAITWLREGDVMMQRFEADGSPVAGDQASARSAAAASEGPSIAAHGSSGGLYALAWIDKASGSVTGRFVKADGGFFFNPVDGSEAPFAVSIAPGRTRRAPAVAIGGSGPHAAFAWEDRSASGGITVRRLPLPVD